MCVERWLIVLLLMAAVAGPAAVGDDRVDEATRARQAALEAHLAEVTALTAKGEAVLKQRTVELERLRKLLAQGAVKEADVEKAAAAVAAAEGELKALAAKGAELQAVAQQLRAQAGGGRDAPAPSEDDLPADDTDRAPTPSDERKPPHPREVTLTLADGTTITGKLTIDSIDVRTRFGELNVPLEKIHAIRPGLDSRPQLKARIDQLVAALGADDDRARQAAADELVRIGTTILGVLQSHRQHENTRIRSEIIKLLERFDEMDEWDLGGDESIRYMDVVETDQFTMAGEVLQKEFELETGYGRLSMSLSDIVAADRDLDLTEEFHRTVSLGEQYLAPRSFRSMRMRIEAGDKVEIRAQGRLAMTRWGSNAFSTPDGAPNYGWYVNGKVPNGALCYKIGSGGTVEKAGSKYRFTAKRGGVLYLGIGMTDRYARTNYRYPGNYKVSVRIIRE